VKLRATFRPDPQQHRIYQEHFQRYQRLYPAVRAVYGRD